MKDYEERLLRALLSAGTEEHYEDAELYDHEYRRRRADINWYRARAKEFLVDRDSTSTRILELGCGTGRLMVPLLRDGHRVLGVDRSATMLDRCKGRLLRLPSSRAGRWQLLQADFRSLPLSTEDGGRFPLIFCPFNAFMHLYTREDIERCLQGVRANLQEGGIFAFDVLLPDLTWLLRDPDRRYARTRFRHPRTGEELIYSSSASYDPVRQIAIIRIFYDPPGTPKDAPPQRVVHLAQRQFFPAELDSLLHYNGFTILRREGSFDGEPLGPTSAEQVICARVR